MNKLILLVAFSLMTSLVFATAAAAQEDFQSEEEEQQVEGPVEEKIEEPFESEAQDQVEQRFGDQAEEQQEEGGSGGSASGGSASGGSGTGQGGETMMESTEPLPQSGGVSTSVLLPAAALILGSGILALAVLRRR